MNRIFACPCLHGFAWPQRVTPYVSRLTIIIEKIVRFIIGVFKAIIEEMFFDKWKTYKTTTISFPIDSSQVITKQVPNNTRNDILKFYEDCLYEAVEKESALNSEEPPVEIPKRK